MNYSRILSWAFSGLVEDFKTILSFPGHENLIVVQDINQTTLPHWDRQITDSIYPMSNNRHISGDSIALARKMDSTSVLDWIAFV